MPVATTLSRTTLRRPPSEPAHSLSRETSAAARLASLAVIADELEGDLIENGVFRDVLDVDQDGDGEGDDERTTGRTPKTETLNALLKVTREFRIGKKAPLS